MSFYLLFINWTLFLVHYKENKRNELYTKTSEFYQILTYSSSFLDFWKQLWKQLFEDVLQNKCSQKFGKIHEKTPGASLFFNKVAGLRPAILLKRRLWHRCFPMNFAKFLRTPFFYRTPPVAASATGIFHKLVSYEKLVSYMSNAKWHSFRSTLVMQLDY